MKFDEGKIFISVVLGIAVTGLTLAACSKAPDSPMGPSVPGAPTATPVATITPGGPTLTVTPTFTLTPITVSNTGNNFSPSSLSVPSGTQVTFNLAGIHTANIDDGSGNCVTDLTNFPTNHTFSGGAGTVYHIHCDNHSTCGVSICTGCTGMVMTVTIQ